MSSHEHTGCTCRPARRQALGRIAALPLAALAGSATALELTGPPARVQQWAMGNALAMRDAAVKAGDQAYGAVVVKGDRIVGSAPSRVVAKRDSTAHAEREAIREAQLKLGTDDLTGCVLYGSSRACAMCETAAFHARISRMYYGEDVTDAGVPERRL